MKTMNKRLIACAVTAALTVPMTAMATNGYFSHGYGMKSKGMAGAGVAYAQDAMAAATNPAGVALVNDRIDFGVDIFMPDRSATVGTTPVSYGANETDKFFIPEFGYTKKIDDKSSWGIVVYGNGGMNTDFEAGVYSSNPSGLNDKTPTGINLSQLFIAPTYARKLNDKHAIGISLNFAYQEFSATGLSNFAGFKNDSSTGKANLTGEGKDSSSGFGLKLGWTGQVTDALTMGFAYQTETKMSKFSKYSELFADAGAFNIPSHYTLGFAFKATPKMNVAVDIQKINYTDVDSISNPNNGYTGGKLGDAGGPGFGWKDMTVFKVGFDYKSSDTLVLRAGWNHGGQPIPSEETAFNVIAPAVVEDHITLGATWTMANKAELTVAYMKALENEVKGSSPSNASSAGHGDLKMSQQSLGVAYGWKF